MPHEFLSMPTEKSNLVFLESCNLQVQSGRHILTWQLKQPVLDWHDTKDLGVLEKVTQTASFGDHWQHRRSIEKQVAVIGLLSWERPHKVKWKNIFHGTQGSKVATTKNRPTLDTW
ncbi:Uncharacterised protein r2_g1073 [Pycnogonum litorale]